jgi:hypothetical protein
MLVADYRFWQTFEKHQFADTFGVPPQNWEEDFWLQTLVFKKSTFYTDDNEPESAKERNVHFVNHPTIIPFEELRVNIIVALQPNKQWYLDNPDEPKEEFWLGKILSHHFSQHGTQYFHCYKV